MANEGRRNEARAGTQDSVRGPPTRPSAGPPAPEGSEGEEAGKVAVLWTIGGRSTERNVTLLFGAKDAEHNNARALVAFVRELGGAA
jgi:hypothetical protein